MTHANSSYNHVLRIIKKIVLSLIGLLVCIALYLGIFGYAHTPSKWWYPFISSIMSDYYTTGPFAMTTNLREESPVWEELPTFNSYLARLSFAMRQGQAETDIAWLFAEQEWPDAPAIGEGLSPNSKESALSIAIQQQGLSYDRISRKDLLNASYNDNSLQVGQARYKALLVNELAISSPELMTQLLKLSQSGTTIIWQGAMPHRATGWARAEQRDQSVIAIGQQLKPKLSTIADASELKQALTAKHISAPLSSTNGDSFPFRSARRGLTNGQLVLLFNDSDHPVSTELSINKPSSDKPYTDIQLLDPSTGKITALDNSSNNFTVSIAARRMHIVSLGYGEQPLIAGEQWMKPDRSFHPFVRWWWPGNDVKREQLISELHSLYAAGFGGAELQTLTIGMKFADLRQREARIYGVGTSEYLANVKTVLEEATQLGMAIDLTMGSGWPNGAPYIDDYQEQQLIQSTIDISGPALVDQDLPAAEQPGYVAITNWVINDTIGEFDEHAQLEAVVAAKIDHSTAPPTLSEAIDLTSKISGKKLNWQAPAGDYRIFALYRNNTSHNLVGAGFPDSLQGARVVDHLHPGGVQEYIDELGAPWLQALAPFKPRAYFIDSFELIGELPWSAIFQQAFKELHGYDIRPYLPMVFKANGESKYVNVMMPPSPAYQSTDDRAERIREDYQLTREQLFRDSFLLPLKAWTSAQGIQLKVQAHGGYGDYLDSYQIADIPEAEGLFGVGSFEFLKLASSAGHVAGRPVISSESFITMSLDFDALTLEDYYLLAGNAYAAGINQLTYHGYAYRYELP